MVPFSYIGWSVQISKQSLWYHMEPIKVLLLSYLIKNQNRKGTLIRIYKYVPLGEVAPDAFPHGKIRVDPVAVDWRIQNKKRKMMRQVFDNLEGRSDDDVDHDPHGDQQEMEKVPS